MKKKKTKMHLLIVGIFTLLIITIFLSNINIYNNMIISNQENLYISEILAQNKSIIQDIDNEYSDYIEIYNDNNVEINLNNYFLSDELTSSKKWSFPNKWK